MTNPPDERGAELRELFFETSQELLQSLNEQALNLEKNPGDEETVRSIRRTVHTLKGDAAACGLRELSELAHQFEDALSLEGTAAHAALAEIAFAAADVFTELVTAYHTGAALPSSEHLRQSINLLTAAPTKKTRRKTSVKVSAHSPKDWTAAEKTAMAEAHSAGIPLFEIVVKIDPNCTMPIAARQMIQHAISPLGQLLVVRPDAKAPAASKQVEFIFASREAKGAIAAKCQIPTIASDVSVSSLDAAVLASLPPVVSTADSSNESSAVAIPTDSAQSSTTPAAETLTPVSDPALPTETQTSAPEAPIHPFATENILRVEAARIDSVLNLVGELIIGKSMLQQALNEFGKRYPKEPLRGKFSDAIAFQARVLNDLQRSVMKIRMVPVDQLFRRFPRIVRDVARQCNREVDLELCGQETDLDKGILDAIAEPLTHLARNAVSHGIETAEERLAKGKPAHGKIRLNAYHQGNQVMVEIADDGRGIDAQKIRNRAVELAMITPEEAARLNEPESLDLIFRPGFSTAERITEVSGRGVGMDVVQSVLQRLKATIHVETRLGQGTTFHLKLPLTLAIIKALLFWVEQRLYAIPLNAVSQIARTFESEVHLVDNYEVLQLRNQVLPLLRLGRKVPYTVDHKKQKLFVLVINVGERKYGLIVDALEGEEELVIKALDDSTFSTDLVNGASILGDGKVVLILNLPAVVEHMSRARTETGSTNFGLLLNHADRARLTLGAPEGHA
jgi:two-component system, chemotaxis family, sensor kinase CheA